MKDPLQSHFPLLVKIARNAMIARGLLADFSEDVLAETEKITAPSNVGAGQYRDYRNLIWSSIDNDDSRDLDQLTVAEEMENGKYRIRVAVADVDSIVESSSAIDGHARHNTTSVYTAAMTFPMLPEKLSTDITSLNQGEDRKAIIVEMVIGERGLIEGSDIFPAYVRNRAKLAYDSVAAWLE